MVIGMKNKRCIILILSYLALALYGLSSPAQTYKDSISRMIRIENNTFYYCLPEYDDIVVITECPVRQVEDDVLILESGISGDYALDGTVVSLSCEACPHDCVRIEISLNVMAGRVYCDYLDYQSEKLKVSECNLVNKEGVLTIPTLDRHPIIVRSIYFVPDEEGFPDFHYYETTREVIRTFLLKDNSTRVLRIGGGTKVSVTNKDIKTYRPTAYPGDHILITESGLTWRGTHFKRIEDEY